MLDLKSKLLAAGFVSKEQVEKVEKEAAERIKRRKQVFEVKKQQKVKADSVSQPKSDFKPKHNVPQNNFEVVRRTMHLKNLTDVKKNEQYEIIRKWVQRNRLDKTSGLPENAERYFFHKDDNNITWLTLERDVHDKVTKGEAAIMTFMSNSGFSHCVVPKEIAEDVAKVFPEWIRVLNNIADEPLVECA